METIRWSVAQIWSKRALHIKSEIQKGERDAYLPIYERQWVSGGKLSSKPTILMPGYLFFEQNGKPLKDAMGLDIEGIIRVLSGEVRPDEYDRLRRGCDLGYFDDMTPEIPEPEVVSKEPPKRAPGRRKPSKKIRLRRKAQRAALLQGITR